MNDLNIDGVVTVIADERTAKSSEEHIAQRLSGLGVPADQVQQILAEVTHGLREGVNAAVMGRSATLSQQASPLLTAAFNEGQRRFRQTVRRGWLWKVAIVIGVVIAAWVVYRWYSGQ